MSFKLVYFVLGLSNYISYKLLDCTENAIIAGICVALILIEILKDVTE